MTNVDVRIEYTITKFVDDLGREADKTEEESHYSE